MATAEELRVLVEIGKADNRRDRQLGLVPPLTLEQVQMLRDFGCPAARTAAVVAEAVGQ